MRQLTVRRPAIRHVAGLLLVATLATTGLACGVKSQNDVASRQDTDVPDTVAPSTTDAPTTTAADETTTTADETTTTEATSTTIDTSGAKKTFITRLAAALVSKDNGDLPITPQQSNCLAPRWVAILGYEKMVKMGVTPEALGTGNGADTSSALNELIGRPEARKLVAAFGACGIDLQKVFVDSIGADSGLTDAQKTCLVSKLPAGYVDQVLVLSLADGAAALDADPELGSTLSKAAQACAN